MPPVVEWPVDPRAAVAPRPCVCGPRVAPASGSDIALSAPSCGAFLLWARALCAAFLRAPSDDEVVSICF